ncbi:MAG TPA: bacillithiol biosynthesis deacetylase BshB1 [Acidobacteriota bacterium]|nr:bacillithiol biosynthesis deacetylase BshB1 [Acidobacteriota bacterium]
MLVPVDVLAVGAHPDDVELGCAGTLLKMIDKGKTVGIVDLTRGELGSRGTAEQRTDEAQKAATLLKASFRENFELPDGDLEVTSNGRLRLVEVIRRSRPSVVVTHFRGIHPDHSKARWLVDEAVHHAGLARIETESARFRPSLVAYWIEFREAVLPQVLVDITAYYDKKVEVLQSYQSQINGEAEEGPETYLSRPGFLDQVRAFHQHLGNLTGCTLAEGFCLSRPPRLVDLLQA